MKNELTEVARPARASLRQRGFVILGILAFIALYQWAYVHWLSPAFAYYGFEYYPVPGRYLALAWACSVLPAVWMPLRIARPSQLAYWVLYLTVFIPSMYIPFFVQLNERADVAWLVVTLCMGMAISGLGYLCPLHKFKPISVRRPAFWLGFMILAVGCAAWVATLGIAFLVCARAQQHDARLGVPAGESSLS